MNILNKTLIKIIPILPKFLVKSFSKRYVAGTTNTDVLKVIKELNLKQQYATVDILGEHTTSTNECTHITNSYIQLLHEIKNKKLDCNVSIKPSHIGSDINYSTVLNNFKKILEATIELKNFLRIDMESSKLTDTTIKLYNELKKVSPDIGIVLQAYLHRTIDDMSALDPGSNIRLCKGIYKESDEIAYKSYKNINSNFLKLLEMAFKRGVYVGIATHDKVLIKKCFKLIDDMNIGSNNFEFQYLHGVPMTDMIKTFKEKKYKVRTYVPFGENWYEYSIRRIKENPKIASYVIKNIFTKTN